VVNILAEKLPRSGDRLKTGKNGRINYGIVYVARMCENCYRFLTCKS